MLAALTGWPQGTFASKLVLEGESVLVTREVDGGLQTVKLKRPAIVTKPQPSSAASLNEIRPHRLHSPESKRRYLLQARIRLHGFPDWLVDRWR